MRILLVNNLLPPNIVGGAEISVGNLRSQLLKCGHKVGTISLDISKDCDIKNNNYKINYNKLNKIWPLSNSRSFVERLVFQFGTEFHIRYKENDLKKIIEHFKPDIVHTNNLAGMNDYIWKVFNNLNIPIVHTLRDYYQICAKQSYYRNNKNCDQHNRCKSCCLLTYHRKKASKYVDAVVGNSQKTLQLHINANYFPSAIKSVISGGLNEVSTGIQTKDSIRIVGYIGQISLHKGIVDYLKFAQLNKDFEFLIAGDGENDLIKKLQSEYVLDNLVWLGRVDPKDFYEKIDILIVPSLWHEPLPRVIYEAYSFGIPVIATDVGGNSDVIFDDDNALYKPGDIRNMLSIFNRFVKNTAEKKIHPLAYITHAKSFLTENITIKYLDIYKKVIQNNVN